MRKETLESKWRARRQKAALETGKSESDNENNASLIFDGQDHQAEIARLANLEPIAYERDRITAARTLQIRVKALDEFVASAKAPNNDLDTKIPAPDPWPKRIKGEALLKMLAAAIRKYVVVTEREALAIATWILHAHAIDAFHISPRLKIWSPEPGCGKTTLLDVLFHLVPKPLLTAHVTAAALFREIDATMPTCLMDEADTSLNSADMMTILNAGHRKNSATVIRVEGPDRKRIKYNVWAPVAYATLEGVAQALDTRSISVNLRRRLAREKVSVFNPNEVQDLIELCRKAARWTSDHARDLRDAAPTTDGLDNRSADNWRPLFAIADLAGGLWSNEIRRAAREMQADLSDNQALGTMLLSDIRELFGAGIPEFAASEKLVQRLCELEGRPWSDYRGRGLTPNAMAHVLRRYNIRPSSHRNENGVRRGYRGAQFNDAFARYLPELQGKER